MKEVELITIFSNIRLVQFILEILLKRAYRKSPGQNENRWGSKFVFSYYRCSLRVKWAHLKFRDLINCSKLFILGLEKSSLEKKFYWESCLGKNCLGQNWQGKKTAHPHIYITTHHSNIIADFLWTVDSLSHIRPISNHV